MITTLMPVPKQQYFAIAGVPLVGGKVYTFEAGTTKPKDTYTNADGSEKHENPIRLNARGEPPSAIFWSGNYRVEIRDALGNLIYTVDNFNTDPSGAWNILDNLADGDGAKLVGLQRNAAGAVPITVDEEFDNRAFTPEEFGAVGDDAADDTAACQAMLDAIAITGGRRRGEFPNRYRITAPLYIRSAMTLVWPNRGPFSIPEKAGYVRQETPGADAFVMVPQAAGAVYAYQFGITDVHFESPRIHGAGLTSRGGRGIGVDTTVNNGDFHVRAITVTNANISYFTTGIEYTGISYLNYFYNTQITFCGTGIKIARGKASDSGGQTRFFGGSIVLCDICLSLNEDASAGSFAIFGMTMSESQMGVRVGEESMLTMMGCELEKLTNNGNGAGLYIEIKEDNPNTSGTKTIIGNKFLSSDADIWVNKTTTTYAGGGFNFPMLLDGNMFQSNLALRINVPAGHAGIDSQSFVIGQSNTGNNVTFLAASQISPLFLGTDSRKKDITRRATFTAGYQSGATLITLPQGMVVSRARIYLTKKATAFTTLQFGDAQNGSRYASFDGSAQPINTWVTYEGLGDFITDSNKNARVIGTAGIQGAEGVVEITGYIP